MKTLKIIFLLMFASQVCAERLNISLVHDSDREKAKREQVLRLIKNYDLEKWWFTNDIVIDDSARSPFSHPVLTLTVSMPNNDNAGLSQLIHEQIHWFEDVRKKEVKNVVKELKKLYPSVPIGYPEGARNEFSTYLHLAVCLLELDALAELVGKDKAETIISTNGKYFYKWIYRTVLRDHTKIRHILKDNGLYI